MKRIAAILLLLLFSCSEKKQSLPELLETWQGKVVSFPTNPVFTRYGKDTVDFNIHPSPYTILFYVDSNSCVDCKLKLNEWKRLAGLFGPEKRIGSFEPISGRRAVSCFFIRS